MVRLRVGQEETRLKFGVFLVLPGAPPPPPLTSQSKSALDSR